MTRVDFYLSSDRHAQAHGLLACRIAEKAYKLGHRIYIHTDSMDEARRLDELLWTFRDGSFVPHAVHPAPDADQSPVLIGCGKDPVPQADVLINLSLEVPPFFSRFERVAEVVDEDTARKTKARERFKFYRDRGYELQTHEL